MSSRRVKHLRMHTHTDRLIAAHLAVEGLSVGDACGRARAEGGSWKYSDDTEMALAILEVLGEHHAIEQDALAAAFGRRYLRDPERGYGSVAYWLLYQIAHGRDWRTVTREVFRGQGSLGNGAAMRAAPIGAYFSESPSDAATQAQLSAEVTHAHPDGQAGAIAVAVAAAIVYEHRDRDAASVGRVMFDAVLEHTPDGPTRQGLLTAAAFDNTDPREAGRVLGDGTLVRSSDTVPLSLWCAARHLDSYESALTAALSACESTESDRDTVCAIVGSLVVLAAGFESIPRHWHAAREPLDAQVGTGPAGESADVVLPWLRPDSA
jgi:ADP-ribosylglycohydrolase